MPRTLTHKSNNARNVVLEFSVSKDDTWILGLFIGQPPAFFQVLRDLASDADRAQRTL